MALPKRRPESGLPDDLLALPTLFAEFRKEMNQRLGNIENRLENIESDLANVDGKVETVSLRLTEIEKKLPVSY